MGLDMFVYKISKANVEERKVYTLKKLDRLADIVINEKDIKDSKIAELKPYLTSVQTINSYYSMSRILKDNGLPETLDADLCFVSSEETGFSVPSLNKIIAIKSEDIEKYIDHKLETVFVCNETQVCYWRQADDIQSRFLELIGHVENCGFYKIDEDIIDAINKEFDTNIPYEDDLFYHEWY